MPKIPHSIRDRHVFIIGASGMGKSTLLKRWIHEDIKRGEGVCVIDPKGDLVRHVAENVPKERIDDVIWTEIDDPLPLDFMGCSGMPEQSVVANLKYILMAGVTDTANMPTLTANIENLLYTFMDANHSLPPDKRCTLLDVAEFFEDDARQAFILKHVTSPRLRKCWDRKIPPADQARILTRVNSFVRNPTLARVFGDPQPRLDINDVIKQRKILLVKVPTVNALSRTYGALIVEKIQQAMFSIDDEKVRTPFYLYVDEFQNYRASEAFSSIMDMARGYCLGLVVSKPNLDGLSSEIMSGLKDISSYILFRIHDSDKHFFRSLVYTEHPDEKYRDEWTKELRELKGYDTYSWEEMHRMAKLESLIDGIAPPLTVDEAARLPQYRAIYKLAEAPAIIADTPKPFNIRSTSEQGRVFNSIVARSKEDYGTTAQLSTKRTVDSEPCNPQPVPHTEGNGRQTPIDYDTIEPT